MQRLYTQSLIASNQHYSTTDSATLDSCATCILRYRPTSTYCWHALAGLPHSHAIVLPNADSGCIRRHPRTYVHALVELRVVSRTGWYPERRNTIRGKAVLRPRECHHSSDDRDKQSYTGQKSFEPQRSTPLITITMSWKTRTRSAASSPSGASPPVKRRKTQARVNFQRVTKGASPPRTQTALQLHAIRQPYAVSTDHEIPAVQHDHELLLRVNAAGLNPIDWKSP